MPWPGLHDVPVVPHEHSLRASVHCISMTIPFGEYLIKKRQHCHHFELDPPVPLKAHIALPGGAEFNVQLDGYW